MTAEGLRAQVRTGDGWAVQHAVLTVTDLRGQQVARVEADADGVTATEPLPAGTYTAILTAAGFEPTARTAVVPAGGGVSLGVVTLSRSGGNPPPPAGTWTIDPAHSSITVTAQHLGLSSVKGRFTEFGGQIEVGQPAEHSGVRAAIQAASVDTGNKMRDDHLRSADFLDVDQYPTIDFVSTGLTQQGPDRYSLSGDLTLHGVTKPVVLDLSYLGTGPDPWGGTRAAFHAETRLHRNDFAINYNAIVRAGIAAVGTTLKVELDIQAVQGDALPEA